VWGDRRLTYGEIDERTDRLAQVLATRGLRRRSTREGLAGHLMLALYRCGRESDAASTFLALQQALAEQFGAEPSQELMALASAIKRHDPTVDAPSTLPIPGTRFIGRRQELDRVADLLGTSRQLTLIGAGGSGKTRLALQLARDLGAADHPDGVHFIELAGSEDGGSVLVRLAVALDVRERPGEDLSDSVVAALRTSRSLLILDNCEHLTSAVHAVVTELLARCSALRVLATSRESLGVEGEQLVPVAGLTVPTPGDGYASAMASDAVRLLAARGAAARSGFQIDAGNIGSAISVCQKLDGLPLAIELAAARLRALSLSEIERRLDDQLDLLSTVSRATVDRHRTIRATMDWSYACSTPTSASCSGGSGSSSTDARSMPPNTSVQTPRTIPDMPRQVRW